MSLPFNLAFSGISSGLQTKNAVSSSGTRGIFGGGITTAASNVMDYININSLGNATDFGDLTVARYEVSGVSSDVRGVFGGGGDPHNVMDYITIATIGNATDFGDLTSTRAQVSAVNSTTRGVTGGGTNGSTGVNIMEYITIATTGNATDFGDLTAATSHNGGLQAGL